MQKSEVGSECLVCLRVIGCVVCGVESVDTDIISLPPDQTRLGHDVALSPIKSTRPEWTRLDHAAALSPCYSINPNPYLP
jgi:hypothetical protein